MTQELLLENELLKERCSFVAQLLRPFVHQICNDVTYLSSTLEWARERICDATVSASLTEATDHAVEMCHHLRNWSAYLQPAKKENLRFARVRSILEDAIDKAETTLPVTIHDGLDGAEGLLEPDALTRSFVALFNNAAEAGASHVEIHLAPTPEGVDLSVWDDGSGFKDGYLSQAVIPFVTGKGYKHHGLGLSLPQSFAADHRGSLHIISSPCDTRVTLHLPMPLRERAQGHSGKVRTLNS